MASKTKSVFILVHRGRQLIYGPPRRCPTRYRAFALQGDAQNPRSTTRSGARPEIVNGDSNWDTSAKYLGGTLRCPQPTALSVVTMAVAFQRFGPLPGRNSKDAAGKADLQAAGLFTPGELPLFRRPISGREPLRTSEAPTNGWPRLSLGRVGAW
jgi:hypothetical protein